MGKGDRKSKKGKIFMGSFGNSRKRKKKDRKYVVQKAAVKPVTTPVTPVAVEAEPLVLTGEAVPKVKKVAAKKKPAVKKEPKAKKTAPKSEE